MTTSATEANRRSYGAPYERQQTRDNLSSHQIYIRPHKKYSRTFFIALIVGVASTIGFFGLALSLLLRG